MPKTYADLILADYDQRFKDAAITAMARADLLKRYPEKFKSYPPTEYGFEEGLPAVSGWVIPTVKK